MQPTSQPQSSVSSSWGANGWGANWQSRMNNWQSAGSQGWGNWQTGAAQTGNWKFTAGQGYNWQPAAVNQASSYSQQSGLGQGNSWQSGSVQGSWQSGAGQNNIWKSNDNNWQSGIVQGNSRSSIATQAKNWSYGGTQGNLQQSSGASGIPQQAKQPLGNIQQSADTKDTDLKDGDVQSTTWPGEDQAINWQSGLGRTNNRQSGEGQTNNRQPGGGQTNNRQFGGVQGANWQSTQGQSTNWQPAVGQGAKWQPGGGYHGANWPSSGAHSTNWQSGGGQASNWKSGEDQASSWRAGGGQADNWQSSQGEKNWHSGLGQGKNLHSGESKSTDWQSDQGRSEWQSGEKNASDYSYGTRGSQGDGQGQNRNSNNLGVWDQKTNDRDRWGGNGGRNWGQPWSTVADEEDWGPGSKKQGPNSSAGRQSPHKMKSFAHQRDHRGAWGRGDAGRQSSHDMKSSDHHDDHQRGWGRGDAKRWSPHDMEGSTHHDGHRGGWGNGDDREHRKRQRNNNDRSGLDERFRKRMQMDDKPGWDDRNHREEAYRNGDYDGYQWGHDRQGGSWGHDGYGNEYDGWGWMSWDRESNWELGGEDYYYGDETYENWYDEGGQEKSDDYYHKRKEVRQGTSKQYEPREEWKPQNKTEDDELLCKKHRALTQIAMKQRTLNSAVKNIMNAMKAASRVLSEDAIADMDIGSDGISNLETNFAIGQVTESGTYERETNPGIARSYAQQKGESLEGQEGNPGENKNPLPPRVLLGVIRVGPAVRKLLMKENPGMGSELVAVFKNKPTKHLLRRLTNLVKENLKSPFSEKVSIHADELAEKIIIRTEGSECPYPIDISCTSAEFGHDYSGERSEDTLDDLSERKCVEALTKIRRVRWSKKLREEIELPIVRIFIDLANRLPGWKHLEPYPAEVLVHTVMEKLAKDVRLSEHTFSRLFVQCVEVLAEGLLLHFGPGLKDPCETELVDVFAYLTHQHAEDLTKAAQSALRYLACERLNDLLGLES